MTSIKHNVHLDGQRNELQNWSLEKLPAHPTGVNLYAGRIWQYTLDNGLYYSPDGVAIVPLLPATALPISAPRLYKKQEFGTYNLQDGLESAGLAISATANSKIFVHCDAMANQVYALSAIYRPRLELLVYRSRGQKANYSGGGGAARAGWKHPDDAINLPAPGDGDGWKGGGTPTYNYAATAARRRTEWLINSRANQIDVTQGLVGRLMRSNNIRYRDRNGAFLTNGIAVIPVNESRKERLYGRRKAWSGSVRDALCAFRFSIIDPQAALPTRIYGPMSEIVRVGTLEHPFIPDSLFWTGAEYLPTAQANPQFRVDQINFVFGDRLS